VKNVKLIILFLFAACFAHAQELNCQVTINTDQIQGTAEKQIMDQLKKSIFEFMNNRQWTGDVFSVQEKIDCSLLIIIKQKTSDNSYSGSIQVESRRPVYKSSYYTPIFNYEDDNFEFTFQQFSTLDFNLNSFQNNLTSVLAYYAYVIIAADYDTFSPLGGQQYWKQAQQVVNNAQTAAEKGWRSNESNKNRYWLVENTLQPVYQGIRDCMFQYNFNGLDIMNEKSDEGRANILKSLDLLKPVYAARPASFNMQLLFNAKADEVVNIFKGGLPDEKDKAYEVLTYVDPARTTKYLKIKQQ
jgi:hypothetical protein